MTGGSVTSDRKPMVTVAVLDDRRNPQPVRFIVDSGFTGQMALPEEQARRLGLRMTRHTEGRPATGEVIRIPAGWATVMWRGHRRIVEVLQLDSEPLLGMEFLWHYRIVIDAVTGGAVTIAPLPPP